MPTIPYDKRQKIKDQALREISWARTYKQGKVGNWKLNEDLYYGRKMSDDTSRANVDLGRMQEFVHTLLSKIDNPLTFKFAKRKESQRQRVARLNALRTIDQQEDDWDIKDIAGKKQAVIYGRAIYSYAADSHDGYKAHLDPVDVYDFLVDPSAGGLDLEKAAYMGRFGVVKMRHELESGIKCRNRLYLKTETDALLAGSGNSTDATQEKNNQKNRTRDQNLWKSEKNIGDPDKYVFWEWYTTFEGERYYLLLSEKGGTAIRIERLEDIFESEFWPFWTWAAFVDLTEFWTPSFADYVREIFMAQAVSVNQMLDNAEQRNKPQRAINTLAVKDLAQLKYRRGGNFIEIDGSVVANVQEAIQTLEVPEINTPAKVYDILERIQEKASGVTAAAKGDAEPDGKATIYEGNQAAAADRFGLLNRSYSFGYKRFAKLYEHGVREHLTQKVSVDILGPNGVEMERVSRRDIFRKKDTFNVLVEASNAEVALSELEKRTKLTFITNNAENPTQNPKKAYEISAGIVGFDDDTIRQLMDTSEFGDAALMSEAERDIEALLDGRDLEPNLAATNAYKQYFIDYMQDHEEDIDDEQAKRLFDYMDKLDPVIYRNMNRKLAELTVKAGAEGMAPEEEAPAETPAVPPEGQNPSATIEQLIPQGV